MATKRGEQIRIHAVGIFEGRGDGVFGDDAQVDGHVAEWQAEIDEQRVLSTLLCQREGKIGGQRGYAATALGAEKDK